MKFRLDLLQFALIALVAGAGACSPHPNPAPAGTAWDAAAPPRGDVRLVVVSDLNSSYGSTEYEPEVGYVVDLIRTRWRPDLVLAAGDLIAGQRPTLTDDNVRAMWAAFDSVVGRPLREAQIPFGFALGNHDASGHPGHERDRAFAARHWRDPAHDPGLAFADRARFPFYYSFEQDGVFVLAWDATTAGTVRDSEQMAWVQEALGSAAARDARMRVVIGHLPLYAVAEGRNLRGEVLDEPDSLQAILERHRVDLYISGHHHAYFPGRRGELELLHAGALGQGARVLIGSDLPPAQTVTLVDLFWASDSVAYTTYRVDTSRPDPLELLDPRELPRVIHGINGHVLRRDVEDG